MPTIISTGPEGTTIRIFSFRTSARGRRARAALQPRVRERFDRLGRRRLRWRRGGQAPDLVLVEVDHRSPNPILLFPTDDLFAGGGYGLPREAAVRLRGALDAALRATRKP